MYLCLIVLVVIKKKKRKYILMIIYLMLRLNSDLKQILFCKNTSDMIGSIYNMVVTIECL